MISEATVKVMVEGERVISTAEGNGPVNALDKALRQALLPTHPEIEILELVDYKVRILEGVKGTDAVTRVLISTVRRRARVADGRSPRERHRGLVVGVWTTRLRYSFVHPAG